MKTILFTLSLLLLNFQLLFAQKDGNFSPHEYISSYKNAAIENMHKKGVPASITLAQGMLESGNGNSQLARKANNHFGIKCHDWRGKSVRMDDDRKNECFRKYNSVLDSYADHADFLSSRSRYEFLFSLSLTDYKGWAKGLKKAGYATSPTYSKKLIDIIEKYNLNQFDKAGPVKYKGKVAAGAGLISVSRVSDIQIFNKRKTIIVAENETKNDLALSLGIKVKQIEKYNEIGPGDEIRGGQLIYLQKKRTKAAKGMDYHYVEQGESLYQISQKYGIQLEALYKKNNMWYGSVIQPGDKIYLRKNKPL